MRHRGFLQASAATVLAASAIARDWRAITLQTAFRKRLAGVLQGVAPYSWNVKPA